MAEDGMTTLPEEASPCFGATGRRHGLSQFDLLSLSLPGGLVPGKVLTVFESAEIGHKIDKARYKREEPKLRRALCS